MIFEIKDFHAPELDVYARLNERELIHLYNPWVLGRIIPLKTHNGALALLG